MLNLRRVAYRSSVLGVLPIALVACFGGGGGGGLGGGSASTAPLAGTLRDDPDSLTLDVANNLRSQLDSSEIADLESYDWSSSSEGPFIQRFSKARKVAAETLALAGYVPPALASADAGAFADDCTQWHAFTQAVLNDIENGMLFDRALGPNAFAASCDEWANMSTTTGASRDPLVCAAAALYITILDPAGEASAQEDCAGISSDVECADNPKTPDNGYECVGEGGGCSAGETCCTDECRDSTGALWNPDADSSLTLVCDPATYTCVPPEDVMPDVCTTDSSGYNNCAEIAFDQLGEMTGGAAIKSTDAAELPNAISQQVMNATSEGSGAIDLLFIIDVTGSMSDDIEAVKSEVLEIISLIQTQGGPGSRVGLFTYGDECSDGPSWRTFTDLTSDAGTVQTALQNIVITGGGDIPESVYPAVIDAMQEASWSNPRRAAIVIGDAGPHGSSDSCYDSTRDLNDAVSAANASGASVNLYPILAPVAY